MDINTGDTVRVDGKVARVTARWAQGKHVTYTLSDGRQLLDIHKWDDVEKVTSEVPRTPMVLRGSGPNGPKRKSMRTVEESRSDESIGEDLLD
jgi:hypothetical protein